jgi:hypothetical protein
MKILTIFTVISLLLPSALSAQVNRKVGNKVSNLGAISASSDREASRLCTLRGGNIVVKSTFGRYTCHYAQQLAK